MAQSGSAAVESGIPDNLFKDLGLIRPGGTRRERDFEITALGGDTFRLAKHRGQVVFLNFWATWCKPCIEEMPAIERLWRRYANGPFVVLAVCEDPNSGRVGPFLAEHRIALPVGLDPAGDLAKSFGVRSLPTTVIIDRDGYIAALAFGPRPWDNKAAIALVEAMTR
jgi:thiol-disulfide isomerase/thioredoxin